MQIPFVGPTYSAQSPDLASARSINWYVEVLSADAKTITSLVGAPGTRTLTTVGNVGVHRGAHVFGSRLYMVVGKELRYMDSSGTVSGVLGELNTISGRVSMADNGLASAGLGGNQLMIVDGTDGYIYNVATNAFTVITDSNFPNLPVMVTYLDGYFVTFGEGALSFRTSALFDGLTWPVLATGSIWSSPDPIQAVAVNFQQLWFVKTNTTEVWYNNGTATSTGCPFSRVTGAILDFGTDARWSVTKAGSRLVFKATQRNNGVGEPFGVVVLEGYVPQVVSDPTIMHLVEGFSAVDDAFSYAYNIEGHVFYVLTFPSANSTLVLDLTTGMWHERSTYVTGQPYAVSRHRGNTYAYFNKKHFLGDWQSGKVLEMSAAYYDDDGEPLVAVRTTQPTVDRAELDAFFISKLRIDLETGTGAGNRLVGSRLADGTYRADGSITADGGVYEEIDPLVNLSWSDNGGRSWSSEHPRSMGKAGDYKKHVVWRRLGKSYGRTFRLMISDPVKRTIFGAFAEAET